MALDSVYLQCPTCMRSFKWRDSYDATVERVEAHRERAHGHTPEGPA